MGGGGGLINFLTLKGELIRWRGLNGGFTVYCYWGLKN